MHKVRILDPWTFMGWAHPSTNFLLIFCLHCPLDIHQRFSTSTPVFTWCLAAFSGVGVVSTTVTPHMVSRHLHATHSIVFRHILLFVDVQRCASSFAYVFRSMHAIICNLLWPFGDQSWHHSVNNIQAVCQCECATRICRHYTSTQACP